MLELCHSLAAPTHSSSTAFETDPIVRALSYYHYVS